MKLFSFLLFTLSLLLFSCNNKKPATSSCGINPDSCQNITEAKDFFYFKMGSWWVYEEETSHVRDSMYVTQAFEDADGYQFDIRIKSALTDYEYHYWPEYYGVNNGCSTVSPINKKCLYVQFNKYKPMDLVGEECGLFIKYTLNDSAQSYNDLYSNNYIICKSIINSYQSGDFLFGKTVKVFQPHSVHENNQAVNRFYSKEIGLIRKELLDSNQVWNLVNYHIEE